MRTVNVAITLALALLSSGCADTPTGVADKFVDLYFVEIDQARVRSLTVGLARQKIDDELKLVESVRRDYQPEQAKPSVYYQRRDVRVSSGEGEGGEHARATYDVVVRHERDVELHRQVMVSLERQGARWRVANFVIDAVGPVAAPPSTVRPPSPTSASPTAPSPTAPSVPAR